MVYRGGDGPGFAELTHHGSTNVNLGLGDRQSNRKEGGRKRKEEKEGEGKRENGVSRGVVVKAARDRKRAKQGVLQFAYRT